MSEQPKILNPLRQCLRESVERLIENNVLPITEELLTAEKGLSVGISCKLELCDNGKQVKGKTVIAWVRRYSDDCDFLTPDPAQGDLELFGGEPLEHAERLADETA